MWNKKASLLDAQLGQEQASSRSAIRIYVLDVPEFAPIIEAARSQAQCQVQPVGHGYLAIDTHEAVEFKRKELNLKPAVWYGLFTGGLRGRIECFDRDTVRIVPA